MVVLGGGAFLMSEVPLYCPGSLPSTHKLWIFTATIREIGISRLVDLMHSGLLTLFDVRSGAPKSSWSFLPMPPDRKRMGSLKIASGARYLAHKETPPPRTLQ
jgi:hypothetical protein